MMGRPSTAKARLLETAMVLMATRGSTVSAHEICQQAGVKKGSFFHFFPSKQALILAVLDAWEQHFQTLWHQALTADGPPLERLTRLFALTATAHQAQWNAGGQMHGCPIGQLALALGRDDARVRQKVQAIFTDWVATVERLLHDARVAGAVPALDTGATAQAIIAYFEGVMLFATTQNDPALITRLAQGAVHLAIAGSDAYPPARQ
jgi:TetR/AcrR family transcriptional repressor of nem operon